MVCRSAVFPRDHAGQLAASLLLFVDCVDQPLEQSAVSRVEEQQAAGLTGISRCLRGEPECQDDGVTDQVVTDVIQFNTEHSLDLVA